MKQRFSPKVFTVAQRPEAPIKMYSWYSNHAFSIYTVTKSNLGKTGPSYSGVKTSKASLPKAINADNDKSGMCFYMHVV